MKSLASLVRFVTFASVALFTIAASFYPGGTHFDHHSAGHDFWRNNLCDVARGVAIGGAPNGVGAAFARAAMTMMALGIGGLFWLLPEHFRRHPRIGVSVRVLGTAATAGAIAVVFLPTDRFGVLHGIAIVVAGIPGLFAATIAVVALFLARPRPRLIAATGVATLLVAAADFGLYVDELVAGGSSRMAVPVLERIASILLFAWVISVTRRPRLPSPVGTSSHTCAGGCTRGA